MAEILLQPNYLSKVIRIALDAKETDSTKLARLTTSRQFNTADTDAWLSFELDGLIETTGEYDLTLINTSEAPSSVVHHARIPFIGNVVHYKLDASGDLAKNEIRHAGRWVGQIVLRLSNGYTTSREFDFTIMGHLMDTAEARLILVEDYNALIATMTASKDELTQYNVDYAALIADVTAAKEVMDQAEIDRQATFNALVDSEMIAQNVEIKLTEKERTYAPRLLSVEQQLADKADESALLSVEQQLADKADESALLSVEQQLADKADESALLSVEQQLAEVKADLQAGIGAVTASVEVVTARTSSVEFDTVLMATNRVVNGDFISGTSGWSARHAALSAANNVLSITGDGTNTTPRVYQITTGKITANTKIYATQRVKVTNAVCSNITVELKSDPTLSALGVFASVTSPDQNTTYRVSGIVQAPSGYDDNNIVLFARNTYADGATASGKVLQLSVPIVLNLTEIFGIGNEPTVVQMDRLLTQFPNSWFTGTENLFLAKWALNELRRLDNDKANKKQESWITPTLVNGATGTFQYRKNEFGRLEFKGELTQASTASYFAITISGYRPPAWIRCPITSIDGVVSMLIISSGGSLFLHTPLAGKTISFSDISINIQ